MHWRNRLKGYSENISSTTNYDNFKKINGVAKLETISEIEETLEETIIEAADDYPEKVVLQATLNLQSREDNKSVIKHLPSNRNFFIYKAKGGVVKKAISGITLSYDFFLSSFDKEKDVIKCIDQQLYHKDFESLSFGEHVFDDKKRSPQNKDLGQSLWSYGAIFTPECNVCQLIQYDFFPIFLNNEIKVKFVKREEAFSLLDDISNGCIKIPIIENDENLGFFYQSSFIKQITQNTAHIYFKKVKAPIA